MHPLFPLLAKGKNVEVTQAFVYCRPSVLTNGQKFFKRDCIIIFYLNCVNIVLALDFTYDMLSQKGQYLKYNIDIL